VSRSDAGGRYPSPVYPSGTGGPPPGWYPDPSGLKAWRWWSGVAWTEWASDPSPPAPLMDQYQPGPPSASPPTGDAPAYGAAGPAPASAAAGYPPGGPAFGPAGYAPALHLDSPQQRFTAQEKAAVWARRAFVFYPVSLLVGMLAAWAGSADIRRAFHQIQAQANSGASTTHIQTVNLNPLSLLNLALVAVFYIFVLVWQYQAASTARLLGLRAARTPGLGVGSWFIPVVNFWFPYQSLRDCLPPDDPSRIVVARLWAFFVAALVTSVITNILAFTGNPAGLVVGGVALAMAAGFAVTGIHAVRLIGDAHRRLLFGT